MKRQASISSFFSKKSTEKKPKTSTPTSTEISFGSGASSSTESPTQLHQKPLAGPPTNLLVELPAELPAESPSKSRLSEHNIKGLHEQFKKKFGAIDQERIEKRKHVESVKTNPTVQKFTPLEAQVVDLKAKYPGCLLVVEVGYKMRFFGDDALIASRVLHIAHFIDRNFYVASFPVHRLDFHVKR